MSFNASSFFFSASTIQDLAERRWTSIWVDQYGIMVWSRRAKSPGKLRERLRVGEVPGQRLYRARLRPLLPLDDPARRPGRDGVVHLVHRGIRSLNLADPLDRALGFDVLGELEVRIDLIVDRVELRRRVAEVTGGRFRRAVRLDGVFPEAEQG